MLAPQQVHEVAGLRGVEDAEPLGQAEGVGIGGDVAVGHGVERAAAGSLVAAQAGQGGGAGQHFVGRPPGKGQEQDAFGWLPRSSRQATREVRARVLPVPAPATTTSGDRPCVATASCASSSPSSHRARSNIYSILRRERALRLVGSQTWGVQGLQEPVQLPSPCLVVLVGPGASGKSTWAAAHFPPETIVSSDRLRALVGSGEDDISASEDAFGLLDTVVERRLRRHLTTVIDTLGLDASQAPGLAGNGGPLAGAVRGCHF